LSRVLVERVFLVGANWGVLSRLQALVCSSGGPRYRGQESANRKVDMAGARQAGRGARELSQETFAGDRVPRNGAGMWNSRGRREAMRR
jgi:hypothetical protein